MAAARNGLVSNTWKRGLVVHMKFGGKTELEIQNSTACTLCIRLKTRKDTVKFTVISPEPKEKDHFFCGRSNFDSLRSFSLRNADKLLCSVVYEEGK